MTSEKGDYRVPDEVPRDDDGNFVGKPTTECSMTSRHLTSQHSTIALQPVALFKTGFRQRGRAPAPPGVLLVCKLLENGLGGVYFYWLGYG